MSGNLFQPPLNPLLEKGGDFWSISLKIKNRTQVYTKKKSKLGSTGLSGSYKLRLLQIPRNCYWLTYPASALSVSSITRFWISCGTGP